jgi:O-antigen/teichoic acid export membrane protein
MVTTGPPVEPQPGRRADDGTSFAEDPLELQHPVLQRLQRVGTVGAGVRRGAAWTLLSRVSAQLIQFLGIIVTARLLTPDDYGLAAIVLPIAAFAGLFSTLGLGSAVVHARRVTEQLLSTVLWLNAATGVLLTLALSGLAFPLASVFDEPLLIPLFAVASLNFTLSLNVVHTSLLERTLRFKQIAVQELVCTVVSIGTVVLVAVAGGGPFSIILGPLAYTIARTLLSWSAVRWVPRALPDRTSLRYLWTYTRGITGFNVLFFWSRNADNLLLAGFVSSADLGNYSRAFNLRKIPVEQVALLMGRVLFPALARLRDDRPRLARAWLRALTVVTIVTAPVGLGMAVAAPAMIEVLFGQRWLGMIPVLELLAVAALPQTVTTTVGGLLRATGDTDALFRLGLIASSLSLVAMLVGLPWGTVGVATSLSVMFFLEVAIFLRPCLQVTDLTWRDLARALRGVGIACLVMTAVGLAVRFAPPTASWDPWQVLVTQVAACAVGYVGALAVADRPALAEVLRLGRSTTA